MKRFSSAPGTKRPSDPRIGRALRFPRLIGLAALLLLAVAILAPAGLASPSESETLAAQLQKAARQALTATEKANREALKAAKKEAIRQHRAAQRAAREAAQSAREAHQLAPKEKAGSVVTIGCTKVTVDYQGFNEVAGSPNYAVEWITVQRAHESPASDYKPVVVSFTGTEDLYVQPVAFPIGEYTIAIHAKWNTNGVKGHFELHSHLKCGPAPAYTIETLQSIAGSGRPPTGEAIAGRVGDVVDYAITATNTGNTPVTFSAFKDPECDAGTITGGSLAAVEPSETVTFDCSHTLTTADRTAGSYSNTATVTGEPEAYEGGPIAHSNTVVVTPIGAEEAKGPGGTTTTVMVITPPRRRRAHQPGSQGC